MGREIRSKLCLDCGVRMKLVRELSWLGPGLPAVQLFHAVTVGTSRWSSGRRQRCPYRRLSRSPARSDTRVAGPSGAPAAGGWQQLLHLVLLEHADRDADNPWKSTCAHDGLLQYMAELTQFVEGKTTAAAVLSLVLRICHKEPRRSLRVGAARQTSHRSTFHDACARLPFAVHAHMLCGYALTRNRPHGLP